MVAKVGINGFGRIGRVVFRTCLENQDLEITAINDPAINVEYICYLIKFDSIHGRFNGNVTRTDNEIRVDDTPIKVFHEKLPSNVPWHTAEVQYVIEACGLFTSLDKASGHLASESVKRVIVTAPSVDVPMVILGVNHNKLNSEHKVISCASSTLYCLAPIIKILEDNYGVDEGFITSIHAMTPSLKPLDSLCLRGKHWRDHRSIHQNIIPATTGACKALGKIIPQVKDKLAGLAFRVPIVNVSVLDLSIRLIKNTSLEDIVSVIDKLEGSTMGKLLKSSKDEAVSSDFNRDSHSCILDVNSSLQLKPNFFKLVCWYENEFSYACRVVDSIMFFEKQLYLLESVSKITYVRPRPPLKRDMVQQTECCSNAAEYRKNDQKLERSNMSWPFPDNETKLQPIRPIISRIPSSNHISGSPLLFSVAREAKRRNEILRVWNKNEIKPSIHQNTDSVFHNCVEIMPNSIKQITNLKKTTTDLEKVKKKLTRIVNITELFKKSDSKKFQTNSSNKSLNQDKIDSTKPFKPELIIFHAEEIVQPHKKAMHKVYGDFNLESKGESCSKEQMSSRKNIDTDISDNTDSDNGKGKNSEKLNLKTVAGFNGLDQYLNCDRQNNTKVCNDTVLLPIPNAVFKNQVTKTTNTLVDGVTQSIDIYHAANMRNQRNKPNIQGQKKINVLENANRLHANLTDNDKDSGFTSPSIKFSSDIDDTSNQNIDIYSTDIDNAKTGENSQIEISSNYSIIENTGNTSIDTDAHKDTQRNRYTSNLDTFNDICPNNNNKVISNVNSRKQDIYDKLDSASATDSNNSFQINERKSQVIHITDLTNSLEDLARLDKICRIIEISDELSDRLFSTLDDDNNGECRKWSFKDLCERIKFDEFCNKLFGK